MSKKGKGGKKGNKNRKAKITQLPMCKGSLESTQKSTYDVGAPNLILDTAIPKIYGGDFDIQAHKMSRYIDGVKPIVEGEDKKRILFISEASYLKTGFSTYLHEVFKRLQKTDKYELAELGAYGNHPSIDPRAGEITWKYYHNMPSTQSEKQEYEKDYAENQFGKWKLSFVLADFKPDIIMIHRDNWMDTHVLKNGLAKNAHICWMACVDGYPQKWEWLEDYGKVDSLFAYSNFGKRVMEEQSRTKLSKQYHNIPELNVIDVIQPGVDLDVFRPMNSVELRKKLNIPQEIQFVGTVMRNQPRKLFPRIIESFAMMLKKYPAYCANVALLLHTSIPDVGFDIPEALAREGVQNRTFFTHICHACGHIAVGPFAGAPAQCPNCKKNELRTPNTQLGLPPEQFSYIYNLLDVYVQGSIAEGDGMPVNEAKACGVPTIVSDYSALAEKGRMPGGLLIENDTIFTESATMQYRSLFSREDLCEKMFRILKDDKFRKKLSKEARKCAEDFYDWEDTAKKWEYHLDHIKIKDRNETWNANVEIKEPTRQPAEKGLSDQEFIKWLYKKILCRDGVDPEGMQTWSKVLAEGGSRKELEAHFRQLIQQENIEKAVRSGDSRLLSPNPIDRVKAQMEKIKTNGLS